MDKLMTWIYRLLGTLVGFMCIENIRFRCNISEKYVLKDDFVRFANESREDHSGISAKLDAIRDKIDGKADK